MRRRVVLDTGPLVAFLDRRDKHHEWATLQWAEIEAPLLTCESVLSEACFLLRRTGSGSRRVMDLVSRRVLALPFRVEEESRLLSNLMEKYADVPMSLADASLVRMIEKIPESCVLTVDGDFHLYRRHGRQTIPLISPGGSP